jgi:hypothetical protein
MSRERPIEVINPPNMLRQKVGGRLGAMDSAAIARAEAALSALSGEFQGWIEDELERLEAARAAVEANYTEATLSQLRMRAHDMKGLGTTYKYPIVTRIADSLCKLLDSPRGIMSAPQSLINGHLDGLRAAIRQKIQAEDHPIGLALAVELERLVALELIKPAE